MAEPVAAYGPAGSTGEENLSVVVAPIAPGVCLIWLSALLLAACAACASLPL